MFRYVLKDFKRGISLKLLIILQMTAVLFLSVVMISSIVSRYKFYEPIKDKLSEKGILLNSMYYANENSMILTDEDQIANRLENVKNISASYVSNIELPELGFSGYDLYSYPIDIFENMPDEFETGEWYSDDSNTIYAAVSCNNFDIKKGDKVHILTDSGEYDIVITGVLKEGAKILGNTGSFALSESTYDNLYMNVYSDSYLELYNNTTDDLTRELYIEMMNEVDSSSDRYNSPMLFMSKKELLKMNISDTRLYGNIFITFEDSITDEIFNKNMYTLNELSYIDNIVNLSDINSRSIYDIDNQLASLLPLIICIYVLTLLTTLCTCLISTEKMLEKYSVFFLCGSSWKNLVRINIGSSSIICLISSILIGIIILLLNLYSVLSFTVIKLDLVQIITCFVIIIVYILLSAIVPITLMKKHTPKEIITQRI